MWQVPLEAITKMIRRQAGENTHQIKLAYMELCRPSLNEICQEYARQGHQHIHIYPLFFAAGRHLRIDVPEQLVEIERALAITTQLHPPIGQAPEVQTAMSKVIAGKL